MPRSGINRRDFLKQTGVAGGLAMAKTSAAAQAPSVAIVLGDDPVAAGAPVQWAAGELQKALAGQGIAVHQVQRLGEALTVGFIIAVAGASAQRARGILRRANISLPASPEALGLVSTTLVGKPVVLACGSDTRGLVYALLELADRAQHVSQPSQTVSALQAGLPIVERPANSIRSVARCFVTDVEDKSWYNDRAMWPQYLSMVAAQRFNRFSLTLGIGYDFARNIRDCYFHFAYPFLVSPSGYDVRVSGLAEGERERNLEMLRFISDETAARGLHFQLGIWTHAFEWTDSPSANHTISGLTAENHAAYCRDALIAILKACPAISGLTFRVHGESGVAEGSYSFWKTVFDGVVRSGRRIEIDMHAKGMDQPMIDLALSTGMPVNISPKFWAEHMGLPYHQAAIRELEMPRRAEGFFALSSGSRRFLRYGYGDLLAEGRRYGILHRIWPGTQRLLLWGDPAFARAYGRIFAFCGSNGVELLEPLSFKGRKGSGLAGGRAAYADTSLAPRYDWQKYLYTYRLWGRLLYNPEAEPETWRRLLSRQFGAAAPAAESALGAASRILPLVTTAHGPSAANNNYWPEMYTNMPIVDAAGKHPYGDSPSPKRFGTVSPFDPQLFSRVDDFAKELLQGDRSFRYSPLEVAAWLEEFAGAAVSRLAEAEKAGTPAGAGKSAEFRRLGIDVAIQSGLGRFFAHKLRSGVLYALYESSGDREALETAIRAYRAARTAWLELAERASGVYASDVTFGFDKHSRGHWLDRLPAIDQDIADMQKLLEKDGAAPRGQAVNSERVRQAVREALALPRRPSLACRHTPPPHFQPGRPLGIELVVEKNSGSRPPSVRLHYRHVNQSETYRIEEMEAREKHYGAAIPATYTESPYPLQYFFELRSENGVCLHPGFEPTLTNQPYFVVRRG